MKLLRYRYLFVNMNKLTFITLNVRGLNRTKSKISFTMEASPLLTVNDYNLIYVCVKQAWLQCMLY